MKKFSLLFLLVSLMTISISCGDDNDPNEPPSGCTSNFTQDYANELTSINDATVAWTNDMSDSNCNALKDAYNDYLDALETWEDCANFYNQVTEWQAAIDATRASIENFC